MASVQRPTFVHATVVGKFNRLHSCIDMQVDEIGLVQHVINQLVLIHVRIMEHVLRQIFAYAHHNGNRMALLIKALGKIILFSQVWRHLFSAYLHFTLSK
jgi:hypothetical protein